MDDPRDIYGKMKGQSQGCPLTLQSLGSWVGNHGTDWAGGGCRPNHLPVFGRDRGVLRGACPGFCGFWPVAREFAPPDGMADLSQRCCLDVVVDLDQTR